MTFSMTTCKVTKHSNGFCLLTLSVILQKCFDMAPKQTSIYDMVKGCMRMAQGVRRLQRNKI